MGLNWWYNVDRKSDSESTVKYCTSRWRESLPTGRCWSGENNVRTAGYNIVAIMNTIWVVCSRPGGRDISAHDNTISHRDHQQRSLKHDFSESRMLPFKFQLGSNRPLNTYRIPKVPKKHFAVPPSVQKGLASDILSGSVLHWLIEPTTPHHKIGAPFCYNEWWYISCIFLYYSDWQGVSRTSHQLTWGRMAFFNLRWSR